MFGGSKSTLGKIIGGNRMKTERPVYLYTGRGKEAGKPGTGKKERLEPFFSPCDAKYVGPEKRERKKVAKEC